MVLHLIRIKTDAFSPGRIIRPNLTGREIAEDNPLQGKQHVAGSGTLMISDKADSLSD
jgi:hypothetical protein